jgi:hypothetical protein
MRSKCLRLRIAPRPLLNLSFQKWLNRNSGITTLIIVVTVSA